MDFFGIDLDKAKDETKSRDLYEINIATSKVKILVIPTSEELEIAKQVFQLLNQLLLPLVPVPILDLPLFILLSLW